MMKINIPTVIVQVPMEDYAAELAGNALNVWVNPPLSVLNEHLKLVTDKADPTAGQSILAWYARIWSQGALDSQWTVDELRELEQKDPALLGWMISATWEARQAHVDRKKKYRRGTGRAG